MSNQLTIMAKELLQIESDLPFRFDSKRNPKERVYIDDFEVYTFNQTWGSTALGFGGFGGQAMTTARTYVFVPNYVDEWCYVYFGGRFAYKTGYSDLFMQDLKNCNMDSVQNKGKYDKAYKERCLDVNVEKE